MKITKLSSETVYHKIVINHTLDVNGKNVRIEVLSEFDEIFPSNGEYDTNINEADLTTLTDEEHEAIGENLTELLDLKDGESTEIDYENNKM